MILPQQHYLIYMYEEEKVKSFRAGDAVIILFLQEIQIFSDQSLQERRR